MKVKLYSEGLRFIAKSGVGKAVSHQEQALIMNHIPCQVNGHRFDYDLLHINTVGPLSVIKANLARFRGKKVVMHAHSTEEDFRDSFFFSNTLAPLFKSWLKFVYRQGHIVITPTPYSKRLLESYQLGVHIESLSNGIDISRFSNNEERGSSFRKVYGFEDADKLVLSVGLQIKRKGLHDFIEVAKKMHDHKFIWCGHTSPHLMTSDIKEAIEHAPSNVYFPGYIYDLIGAYSAADVFFMPTYEETEGIVILEALAMKKPVVVRDIPVYDQWLEHGKHCYKGKDNKAFIQLLSGVTSKSLKDLSETGWEVARMRDVEAVGRKLAMIYGSLVGDLRHEV